MQIVFSRGLSALLVASAFLVLGGCATLAQHELEQQTREQFEHYSEGPVVDTTGQINSAAAAARAALQANPQIAADLARLGLDRAALIDARRLTNPGFGLALLDSSRHDEQARFSANLSQNMMELLLYPLRRKLGERRFAIARQEAVLRVIESVLDAKRAWFNYSAASLLVATNERAQATAQLAAELATRYAQAGNLNSLVLARYRADAAESNVTLAHSKIALAQAQARLRLETGITDADLFQIALPMVPANQSHVQASDSVFEQHPRMLAQNARVALLRDVAQLNRRMRLFGQVQAGVEYEHEGDGAKFLGPRLEFGLPVFSQGQSAIAAAEAELAIAQAHRDRFLQDLNALQQRSQRQSELSAALAVELRDKLIPAREQVYRGALEQVNFMLIGVFDLVDARQELFAAWRAYIEASRDYWLAEVDKEFVNASIDLRQPENAPIELHWKTPDNEASHQHNHGNH